METSLNHILLEGIVKHGFPKRMIELIEHSDHEDLDDDKELIAFLGYFYEYTKDILKNSRTKTPHIKVS
jgi:hypothetical protein